MDLHGRVPIGSFQALTQDPMTEEQGKKDREKILPLK